MWQSIKKFFGQMAADIAAQGLFGWFKGTAVVTVLLAFWDWINGRSALEIVALSLTIMFLVLGVLELVSRKRRRKSPIVGNTPPPALIEKKNETFNGGTVLLDGHRFITCTFKDTTLQFNGGVFDVIHCRKEGNITIATNSLPVMRAMSLLNNLDFMKEGKKFIAVQVSTDGDGKVS